MIKIESKKNKFTYNVYHVTKAFYPKEDIVQTEMRSKNHW